MSDNHSEPEPTAPSDQTPASEPSSPRRAAYSMARRLYISIVTTSAALMLFAGPAAAQGLCGGASGTGTIVSLTNTGISLFFGFACLGLVATFYVTSMGGTLPFVGQDFQENMKRKKRTSIRTFGSLIGGLVLLQILFGQLDALSCINILPF